MVKRALHGALLHASAIDICPQNQLIPYWYESFIIVRLWLAVLSQGSRMDWHGNWHQSSLAHVAFQTHEECWDLMHLLSDCLHNSFQIT